MIFTFALPKFTLWILERITYVYQFERSRALEGNHILYINVLCLHQYVNGSPNPTFCVCNCHPAGRTILVLIIMFVCQKFRFFLIFNIIKDNFLWKWWKRIVRLIYFKTFSSLCRVPFVCPWTLLNFTALINFLIN